MNVGMLLYVGIGGFIGAISRYSISNMVIKIAGTHFPYSTLLVNVIGAFGIGFLFLYFQHHISPTSRLFWITGLLGALTTFSTFSLETVMLLQDQQYAKATISITLNVMLSIIATLLGMLLYKKLYAI